MPIISTTCRLMLFPYRPRLTAAVSTQKKEGKQSGRVCPLCRSRQSRMASVQVMGEPQSQDRGSNKWHLKKKFQSPKAENSQTTTYSQPLERRTSVIGHPSLTGSWDGEEMSMRRLHMGENRLRVDSTFGDVVSVGKRGHESKEV